MEVFETGEATPITILTGFLGAGKTTLLNRILNGDHGLKIAVLVNDFGSINIDAELVVGVESDVISLANGCICCTIRDDLVETVLQTIDRPERPAYILLEASGVAEPLSIAQTFNNPSLRERLRTDSVMCVVDAEQVFAAPETMQLKLFQMACADLIILNKVELVSSEELQKVRDWIDSQFHRYRLIETSYCELPLDVLLSVGRFDPAQLEIQPRSGDRECCGNRGECNHQLPLHGQQTHGTAGLNQPDPNQPVHAAAFSTWSYETEHPLSLEALREVAAKLPVSIYRAKGIIYSADAPERRVVLQVAGRRVDLSLADEWSGRTRRTRIVAIGASNSPLSESLSELFDAARS